MAASRVMVSPALLAAALLAFASAYVPGAEPAREVPPPALLGAWFADSSPESPIFLGETAAAIKAASRSQSALKDGMVVTLRGGRGEFCRTTPKTICDSPNATEFTVIAGDDFVGLSAEPTTCKEGGEDVKCTAKYVHDAAKVKVCGLTVQQRYKQRYLFTDMCCHRWWTPVMAGRD